MKDDQIIYNKMVSDKNKIMYIAKSNKIIINKI